jgi:hypothetical protein
LDSNIVSKAALARELHCSRASITNFALKGMPVRPDGKVVRTRCLRWIRNYTSGFAGGWGASLSERAQVLLAGEPLPPAGHRAHRSGRGAALAAAQLAGAEARARLAMLQVERMRSGLLPAAEVAAVWGQLRHQINTRLLAIAADLAPQVATMGDVFEVRAAIAAEVHRALSELAAG